MTRTFSYGAILAALTSTSVLAQSGVGAPTEVTLTPFVFQTIASRNPDFESTHTYPSGDLAGQPNPDTGDIRLDGVSINGVFHGPEQLQLVISAAIVVDDAVDLERGGHNLAAGRGIGADADG